MQSKPGDNVPRNAIHHSLRMFMAEPAPMVRVLAARDANSCTVAAPDTVIEPENCVAPVNTVCEPEATPVPPTAKLAVCWPIICVLVVRVCTHPTDMRVKFALMFMPNATSWAE